MNVMKMFHLSGKVAVITGAGTAWAINADREALKVRQ